MTDIYDSERKRNWFIDVINNSGSKHFNITELRSELYDLNIKGLFHPKEEHSKPQESSDSFDELFKGIHVDVNQLNISHFDIPEVWKMTTRGIIWACK